MNSLELVLHKRCKEILIIGNKANQYNQIHIQEQKYSWIKEFSEYFKSYRLTESQKEETSNNMTLTHYPNFNLDFQYFQRNQG